MSESVVWLKDHQPCGLKFDRLEMTFDIISLSEVIVEASMHFEASVKEIVLDGQKLELIECSINDRLLQEGIDYQKNDDGLMLFDLPSHGVFKQKVRLNPASNTELCGLYQSDKMLCTQCEAQGFRHIVYFTDRPDVLTKYHVTIKADPIMFPVLLSNGNEQERYLTPENRLVVVWYDPFDKPSYLFALVAGDLTLSSDTFVTQEGQTVDLKIYTEHQDAHKTQFAMEALKKSMQWDEQVYGLSYDLRAYHIVATHHFNMGAMENKGLNLFNARYVLGDHDTCVDQDYLNILAVVAHEYFHNWTGNRVTLRDWFQLSLKEGLTVFREQQFMQDQLDSPITRIKDVQFLLAHQFPEDASALAHPVRPESYSAIDNFYTTTVYEKGAELVRMFFTLRGAEPYYEGMKRYFSLYDGSSATLEDFYAALAYQSNFDLEKFWPWYQEHGTLRLKIILSEQEVLIKQEHSSQRTFMLPLSLGWVDVMGRLQPAELLTMTQKELVIQRPWKDAWPVLNHSFVAPVMIDLHYPQEVLKAALLHEKEGVACWLLMQEYWAQILMKEVELDLDFLENMLEVRRLPGLQACLWQIPSYDELLLRREKASLADYIEVESALRSQLGSAFYDTWIKIAQDHPQPLFTPSAIEARSWQSQAFAYACAHEVPRELIETYQSHSMMTTQLALLRGVSLSQDKSLFIELSEKFKKRYAHDRLVIANWLRHEALSSWPRIEEIANDTVFEEGNPNHLYALLRTFFSQNLGGMHQIDGSGYQLWSHFVKKIDALNPQVAARIAQAPAMFRKWDQVYRDQFEPILDRLLQEKLSVNTMEMLQKMKAG